jgi:signal transduction histidine kinase
LISLVMQQAFSRQLIESQEQERKRIAAELRDE